MPKPENHAPTSAKFPGGDGVQQYICSVCGVFLLLAAAGLGLLFFTSPYHKALALGGVTYNDEGFYRLSLAVTPARYQALRGLLAGSFVVGLLIVVGLRMTGRPTALLRAELRHGRARLQQWWHRLPASTKLVGVGLTALLVVVRVWYLLNYPLGTDEVASYDYFVREGPLAITSFYPIPNNHIFFNLLAWPLAETGLSPRLVMRLPTLLVGTLGTVAGYVLLARLLGARFATLVTGLTNLGPLWVYYAAAGRGYFIEICLVQLGFFAVVELLRPASAYVRLSWLAFIGSSILGMYTIPTYAYPLASLALGLGGGLLLQRRWARLPELVAAGLGILVVTALLYAPIVTVSGWGKLVSNRYVAAKTAAQFWPPFRAILYETAAELFGPSLRLSGPAWLAGALLGGLVVNRWVPAGPRRTVGLLAWVLLAMPLVLMAAQRVYAPVRTILYLTFYGYLLGVLLFACLPIRRWLAARWQWPVIIGMILSIGGFRLFRHQAQVRASRYETQQLEQAYRWLNAQPAGTTEPVRVWLYSPLHELFFAHYATQEARPNLRLQSGGKEGPRMIYDFVVLDNYFSATAETINRHYQPIYHDYLVTIYIPRP